MSRTCPDGRPGALIADGSRGTAPRYELFCPGDRGYAEARALDQEINRKYPAPFGLGGTSCPPGFVRVTTKCGAASQSYCEPSPQLGPRPGESTCDYRRRIGSPLVMFSGCSPRAMGDAASDLRALPLPGSLERYLATGAPMSTIRRDLGAATAQIPRWVYGLGAGIAILLGAKAYTRWRDAK